MTKPASSKRSFLKRLLKRVEEHAEQQVGESIFDPFLGKPDWRQLKILTSLDTKAFLQRYLSKIGASATHSNLTLGAQPQTISLLADVQTVPQSVTGYNCVEIQSLVCLLPTS